MTAWKITRRSSFKIMGLTAGALMPPQVRAAVTFRTNDKTEPEKPSGEPWHAINLAAGRYIQTNLSINGRSVTGIVDTGATRTVVSKDWVERLGLQQVGTATAKAFTGMVSGNMYRIDSLRIDAVELKNLNVASYEMKELAGFVPGELPVIVGRDVINELVLDIQFYNDRMKFLSAIHTDDVLGFGRLACTNNAADLPTIRVQLGSDVQADAVVDLGSNVICTVSEQYAAQMGLTKGKKTSTTLTAGVEGSSESLTFTIDQIRIGEFRLVDVPVCVVRNWAMSTPVNLGWPLFRAFELLINLKKSELWLKPDLDQLAAPFPKDRSGLGAVRLEDRMIIRHVAFDSPAEHAGLKPGDEIVAINGRPIDASFPAPGDRQGYKPAGTKLSLRLATGATVDIILADYF